MLVVGAHSPRFQLPVLARDLNYAQGVYPQVSGAEQSGETNGISEVLSELSQFDPCLTVLKR